MFLDYLFFGIVATVVLFVIRYLLHVIQARVRIPDTPFEGLIFALVIFTLVLGWSRYAAHGVIAGICGVVVALIAICIVAFVWGLSYRENDG